MMKILSELINIIDIQNRLIERLTTQLKEKENVIEHMFDKKGVENEY